MSRTDIWSNPSHGGANQAAEMVAGLEDSARRPDQSQVNNAVRNMLAPMPSEQLLEVGSGSGALCRLMAPRVVPNGHNTCFADGLFKPHPFTASVRPVLLCQT